MPSWLATTQEKYKFVQNMGLWIFSIIFSHYFPLLPMFCPTQGYLLKFLALTHHKCVTSGTIPPRSHVNAALYMFLILQLKPLLCIINLQYQSLIELNTSKNTKPAMMQLLVQRKSNNNYSFLQALDSTRSTIDTTQKPQTYLLCL